MTKLNSDVNLRLIGNKPTNKSSASEQEQTTGLVDTNIIRRIVDANIVSRDLLKQAFEANADKAKEFGPDSSLVAMEITKLALDIGETIEQKNVLLEQISDFMISELSSCVEAKDISALISFQFGIKPLNIK